MLGFEGPWSRAARCLGGLAIMVASTWSAGALAQFTPPAPPVTADDEVVEEEEETEDPTFSTGAQGPSDAEKEKARNHFYAGDEAYRAGDFPRALTAFRAAHRIMNVPTTGLEVGRTQMQLGELLAAQRSLKEVLDLPPMEDETPPMLAARDEARVLHADVSRRIPRLDVTINGLPDSADSPVVTIDGQERLASGEPIRLDPGRHVIRVDFGSLGEQERIVHLDPYQRRSVSFVVLTIRGKQEIAYLRDEDVPDSSPRVLPPLAWTSLAVGLVSLGAGAITGGLALSKENTLEESCPERRCNADMLGDLETAKTLADASTVTFAVGGALAGLGVIGLIVDAVTADEVRSDDETSWQLTPQGLRWRF